MTQADPIIRRGEAQWAGSERTSTGKRGELHPRLRAMRGGYPPYTPPLATTSTHMPSLCAVRTPHLLSHRQHVALSRGSMLHLVLVERLHPHREAAAAAASSTWCQTRQRPRLLLRWLCSFSLEVGPELTVVVGTGGEGLTIVCRGEGGREGGREGQSLQLVPCMCQVY